ncbi:MAG: sulfite exporter TauE/SafE family protein, partial [Planctomycetes bacterium]|nr:sulfite exporter TauE/SafE family protein [Planctomycetota bacterium]
MDLTTTLVYVTAGLAGAINALAGGGTLLTFPALLPLMTPTQANMTSTIALLPGSMTGAWTYRREIGSLAPWFMRLLPASLVGSLIGSLLLALDPSDTFKIIVP